MHEAVTKSSTATKSFFPTTSDDLLAPISLKSRPQATDALGWSQTHDSDEENWHLPTPNDKTSAHMTALRRAPQAGIQKIAFPSTMPTRSDSKQGNGDVGSVRWRFNTNGQFVDAEATSPGWELADEIVRLKIGEVAGDGEDVHTVIRTPPKSKLASAAVSHLSEASPLDTSSNTSVGSSPHPSDHEISISHSRGSSTDTTNSSSHESVASNTLLAHSSHKSGTSNEAKERPHSFSGGLTSADLRRLQQAGDAGDAADRQIQQQWAQNQYRESMGGNDKQYPSEQLSYPSLSNYSGTVHGPQPQPHPQLYDYQPSPQANLPSGPTREDLQIDYNLQQRNYNPLPQGHGLGAAGPVPSAFVQGRPTNSAPGMPQYRQPPRNFPQQGLLPSPTNLGYPAGHTSHLSLGSTQQLYDMMLAGPPHESHHPAVTRVQQQHNIYRATHHHSASDPSAIRDATTLALLSNNMQAFGPGMFQQAMPPPQPAMAMYPNQFYGAQEAYSRHDLAAAQAMASRLQPQYTGYGVVSPQGMQDGLSSPTSTTGQNGPSANNRKLGLYKTELCRSWEEKGTCRYGAKCQFAHGEDELRKVARHPKYKTEICRTFWVSGSCPYGKRCCFIHTELPSAGGPGGVASATDNAPPPPRPDGRARSLSTNSDPNDASISLLARISAKRNQDPNNGQTPIDMSPNSNFPFTRPPTGSLRVDTSALDGPTLKQQNKSAYPSFASNGILLPAPEHISAKSPAPVTAGPDLGRHNNSRLEIVGYNNQRATKSHASSSSSVRHSINGSEIEGNFSSSPSVNGHSSFTLSSGDNISHVPRASGHVRAGSAGNWGSFSRSSHLGSSPYPHASSPAGDITVNSPWSTTELAVGSSRLHEKTWA